MVDKLSNYSYGFLISLFIYDLFIYCIRMVNKDLKKKKNEQKFFLLCEARENLKAHDGLRWNTICASVDEPKSILICDS